MRRLKVVLAAVALAVAVSVVVAGPAAAKGGNSANVKRCANGGWANLYDANTGLLFSNQGACIAYGARGQAYALLEVEDNVYDNEVFGVWGSLSGFGLAPNASIQVFSSTGATGLTLTTDVNGNIHPDNSLLNALCRTTGVYATTTTPTGATIRSKTVDSPCGG